MIYKRKIYQILEKNLENNKIIILTGSRQVGKTTLLKALKEQVDKTNKSVFLDMDIGANLEFGEDLQKLMDLLVLNGYSQSLERFYLFVDEFQRVPSMVNILKNLYDHYQNIKIFASGSSSLSIKNNIKESLAGRKFIFDIYPLDFEEFIEFKQDKKAKEYFGNIDKLKSRDLLLPKVLSDYLAEFLTYGGYPEVVLQEDEFAKQQILKSIFDLYLEKDVMVLMGVENILAYKKLVQLLAVSSGQTVNYNNLANESGIHNQTVRSYLGLLEESYLIKIIRPYHTNLNKEIKKTPKIYFQDNGVRNFFLNNYNLPERRIDSGHVYETYVLSELFKNLGQGQSVNFWRTKQKEEVDFVLNREGFLIPIEVKKQAGPKKENYRHVLSFLKKYDQKTGYVLSGNYKDAIEKQGKQIKFLPAINFVSNIKS